jgi:hypothetical protein
VAAGGFDYEAGGEGYSWLRRTDPRIEAYVHAALRDAATVLNVGAGVRTTRAVLAPAGSPPD